MGDIRELLGVDAGAIAAPSNMAAAGLREAVSAPYRRAIVNPLGRDRDGRRAYTHLTFHQLAHEIARLSHGLPALGIVRGMRTLLAVKPDLHFTPLVYALLNIGAVPVLIDPGMGLKNLFTCIADVEPDGLIAIDRAQRMRRVIGRRAFKSVRVSITVGRRTFGDPTIADAREIGEKALRTGPFVSVDVSPDDPSAILFTSGSTGPAKGVVSTHGIMLAQTAAIRDLFGVKPGDVHLAAFPPFALFSTAMGATAVMPDLDPTRPATCDPALLVEGIEDQGVNFAFGSPAIWRRVADYCEARAITLPSIRNIMIFGAPIPPSVLARFGKILSGSNTAVSPVSPIGLPPSPLAADVPNVRDGASLPASDPRSPDGRHGQAGRATPDAYTPYGATEGLPIACIGGREVAAETGAQTALGKGYCVGMPAPGVDVRIIKLTDQPIPDWHDSLVLPQGEIGEITVRGPVVTREYFRNPEHNARAKIVDGDQIWHRMGDVGYLDERGRLWMCGRKGQRVRTASGDMFTVCCEAIFNEHRDVCRSALVGAGLGGVQKPVIVIEPTAAGWGRADRDTFKRELLALARGNELTRNIDTILFHRAFPVDIRHNAKIFREQLAVWAAKQVR